MTLDLERRAVERICGDLRLPIGDSFTQDWIYELPQQYRNMEFLAKYAAAYSNPEYGDNERLLLMQLMLDVTNELLEADAVEGKRAWESVATILRGNPQFHREQIEYWAMPGMPLEEAFSVTPLVRLLRGAT